MVALASVLKRYKNIISDFNNLFPTLNLCVCVCVCVYTSVYMGTYGHMTSPKLNDTEKGFNLTQLWELVKQSL